MMKGKYKEIIYKLGSWFRIILVLCLVIIGVTIFRYCLNTETKEVSFELLGSVTFVCFIIVGVSYFINIIYNLIKYCSNNYDKEN